MRYSAIDDLHFFRYHLTKGIHKFLVMTFIVCSRLKTHCMSMYMPGATAVGITFDQGVVFASEKRIAYGNFLVSKSTKKTFPNNS